MPLTSVNYWCGKYKQSVSYGLKSVKFKSPDTPLYHVKHMHIAHMHYSYCRYIASYNERK